MSDLVKTKTKRPKGFRIDDYRKKVGDYDSGKQKGQQTKYRKKMGGFDV